MMTVEQKIAEYRRDLVKGEAPSFLSEVTKFEDLFESATEITDLSSYKHKAAHTFRFPDLFSFRKKKRTVTAEISTFCSVTGPEVRKSYDIVPKAETIELVRKNMMLSEGYVINFEIHLWEDGLALVTAHYNMISGSRWFSVIDASTIPGLTANIEIAVEA